MAQKKETNINLDSTPCTFNQFLKEFREALPTLVEEVGWERYAFTFTDREGLGVVIEEHNLDLVVIPIEIILDGRYKQRCVVTFHLEDPDWYDYDRGVDCDLLYNDFQRMVEETRCFEKEFGKKE